MAYLEELLPEFRKGAKIRLTSWGEDTYVMLASDGMIINNREKLQVLYTDELMADCWGLYQEPIDWDYIIKNKCLCWFWDEYENCKVKGTLAEVENDNEYPFRIDLYNSHYRHCRPCRRDEVTFYEDEKNE